MTERSDAVAGAVAAVVDAHGRPHIDALARAYRTAGSYSTDAALKAGRGPRSPPRRGRPPQPRLGQRP